MKNKIITKNSGLTLIEVIIAMSIFAVVISVAIGVFVSGSSSQRKILELNATQKEASYLMETISREMRMATAIDSSQENVKKFKIEFTNYNGDVIKYCRSDSAGSCDENGKHFSRAGENINSPEIEIEKLTFYSTDDFDGPPSKQPIITVVMKVKSTGSSGAKITLQNSVSLRLY